MGAGKALAIIAALLTILGTFVFAMFEALAPDSVGSGIAIFQDLNGTFENVENYDTVGPAWLLYILIIVLIIFAISGFVQFIGIKSRAGIFIFSLFPLTIAILILIIGAENSQVNYMMLVMSDEQVIIDVYPYLIPIYELDTGYNIGLGTYLVLSGGIIGIISALLPRENSKY